ncbi:MAG: CotH kinase family protein, partial [Verrucomicrobiota bacterium]
DLDAVSRYLAVTVWISTLDSILGMGQNFLAYLNPKTDRFELWPWDLDHAFGQFGMTGSQEERENLSLREPWTRDIRFLQRLMKVPRFSELYLGAMKKYQDTLFQPARLQGQVDALARVLRPAVAEEDADKLQRFDQVVAGQPVPPAGPFGGGPGGRGGPGGPGGFPGMPRMTPPKPIKGFVEARHASVRRQLTDPAAGQRIQPGMFGGGPRGPGGRGGPDPGPGGFLARPFLTALDADQNGKVTRAEFQQGFQRWFGKWDTEKAGRLDLDALRAGMNSDLSMFPGGPPPGGPEGRPNVLPLPAAPRQ